MNCSAIEVYIIRSKYEYKNSSRREWSYKFIKLETHTQPDGTLVAKLRDAVAKSSCYINSMLTDRLQSDPKKDNNMRSGIHQLSENVRCSLRNTRWRTSFSSISNWWSRSTYTNDTINTTTPTTSSDPEKPQLVLVLPKLPVPHLQHTLTRYLEALEVILPEDQFFSTRSLVNNFGCENGIGEGLQRSLIKRRDIYDNWAYDWWLDDMYLNNPVALPVNSNPGMVFPLRDISATADMAKFAARIVTAALAFKDKIDKNELETEMAVTDGVSQPLCMAQYSRIFTSYRAPGMLKDSLLKIETEFTKARPHIIVACREQCMKSITAIQHAQSQETESEYIQSKTK